MALMVLRDFQIFDLFEVEDEYEIRGHIDNEQLKNKELTFSNFLDFNVKISRKGYKFLIEGDVNTEIILLCDRCLNNFKLPIYSKFRFLFIYKKEVLECINEHFLNLKELILSEVYLNMPFKKLCSNKCKGLCPVCGEDRNLFSCKCDNNSIESPFARLKILF